MNRRQWLAMAGAGALIVGVGTSWAAGAVTSIVAADGTISGCYRAVGEPALKGQLRVLGAGQRCKRNERAISWNQKGPRGATGAPGTAGQAGSAGAKGELGSPGPQGATGAVGPLGVAGAAGVTGAKGDVGAIGPKGAVGATGATGVAGATGATGATGAKGDRGDPGAGVVWQGDWQSGLGSPMYSVGSLVRHNGAIWIARQPTGGGCRFGSPCPPAPGTDDAVWQLFATDGLKGDAGDTGATGPAGPPGATSTYLVGSVTVSTDESIVGNLDSTNVTKTAACPPGTVVSGGGYTLKQVAPSPGWPTITANHAAGDSGWKVEAVGFPPYTIGKISAWATCVRLN